MQEGIWIRENWCPLSLPNSLDFRVESWRKIEVGLLNWTSPVGHQNLLWKFGPSSVRKVQANCPPLTSSLTEDAFSPSILCFGLHRNKIKPKRPEEETILKQVQNYLIIWLFCNEYTFVFSFLKEYASFPLNLKIGQR